MLDIENIKNISFDLTSENIKKAKKVYTIADLLEVGDNPFAVELSEAKNKINNFANSKISKTNKKIQESIGGIYGAITTLDIINKTATAYRKVKPKVKLAVNVGGIWRNFANIGEIAQDAVQMVFRDLVGKGKETLERYLTNFFQTPIMLKLGDDEGESEVILSKYKEYESKFKEEISNYLIDLSLDDYLELVRIANDDLLKKEKTTTEDFKYSKIKNEEANYIFADSKVVYIVKNEIIYSVNIFDFLKETIATGNNFRGFIKINENIYYSVERDGNADIYKNNNFLGTINGVFKGFKKSGDVLLAYTNLGAYYSDNLTSFYSGDVINLIPTSVGTYINTSTSIFLFEPSFSSWQLIYTESLGEITDISFYDYLYFSVKKENKISVNKFIKEKEFAKKTLSQTGFSFIKDTEHGTYAYKNNTLFKIEEIDGSLIFNSLTSRLPGDISDIDIVEINSVKYYISAVGSSLFIANENNLNKWEEKVVDFQNLGMQEGLISNIKSENNELFFSSLKTLLKIDDNNSLLPITQQIAKTVLTWDKSALIGVSPPKYEESEIISPVSASIIKSYDEIIYKIFSKEDISFGNKIEISGELKVNSIKNIYSFLRNGIDIYYIQGKSIFVNENELVGIDNNESIIGFSKLGEKIKIFTENYYFEETGRDYSITEIKAPFQMRVSCNLISDGNSLLINNNGKLLNYNKKNKEIKDLLQTIDNIKMITLSEEESFVLTNSSLLKSKTNKKVSLNEKYHNGYKNNIHYEIGKGIAPFDLRSNIIKNINIIKKDYIENLRNEFEEHFYLLMEKIPQSVSNKISKDIFNNIIKNEETFSKEEEEIISFLRENVLSSVSSLFEELMKNNFSISPEDGKIFTDKLIERLSKVGVNEITDEFYFVAMEAVKNALEQSVYDLNSVELWNYVIEYYNNHKYEWAEQIKSYLKKDKLDKSMYLFAVNTSAEIEYKNYFDYFMNDVCLNEINAYIYNKSGEMTEEENDYIKNIITSKIMNNLSNMSSFSEWINSITEASATLYIPGQQTLFIESVNISSMEPVQWDELPRNINKETFTRLLNILLDLVKDEIKKGIVLLVENGEVPCHSCVEPNLIYKEIEKLIEEEYKISKLSTLYIIDKTKKFEDLPKEFYIPSSANSNKFMERVFDNQTNLYLRYLNTFVDAIIESSEENYVEEPELS